ncbi:MAG TPA: ABC transporter transmembrane domain-containing protein [Steroidobacteraceae bacterium]|nr:ABC transporter transmembrane domain-containing protein [Steroidobacteraceae bacterium]
MSSQQIRDEPPPAPEPTSSERAKSRSLRPLRELLPFLSPYKGMMAFALVALLVAAGAMLALPIALKLVIDNGFTAGSAATINQYFIGLLFAAAVFGLFAALRFYLVSWLGERVVADIRDAVYRRVIRLDPAFFEVTKTGEVLSRLTTDTTLIQSIAGAGLSILLRSSLTFLGSLVLLFYTSTKLTLIIIVLIPAVLVPILVFGRKVRKLSRVTQDRIADTSGLAGETLNAVQTVQAFTLEELHSRRYEEAVERSFDVAIERTLMRAWLTALAILTVFGAITLVLWLGARDVLGGAMTGGQLAQFLGYAVFMATAAASLSEMWGEVQRAAGAMERTVELLRSEPSIKVSPTPVAMPSPGKGRIVFENVTFRYPSRPNVKALNDFSLAIEPGETLAFVGPSGAGKSTTFQLLLRFYDQQSGRILIDGVDTLLAEPEAVRRGIGLVPQETVIFGATARENIRYGRPDASDAAIEAAARAAAADDFIVKLPEGYDTYLGERGARLSGGQKQRIAIARAILKDPPILLLDEATSSLDSESERLVQEALERLMRTRTTIIIAHRLATAVKADRIVVIEHGRIVGIGPHEELIRSNALYARLAELQFGERADLAGVVA